MTSHSAKRTDLDPAIRVPGTTPIESVPGRQTLSSGLDATVDADIAEELPPGGGTAIQLLDLNSYQDRVTMLTMIANAHGSPAGMPNPADGIPIQTQWQQNSGRDQMQWWSNVNFSLSVSQFLALQANGEFPNVVLTGTPPIQLSSNVYALAQDYWSYQAYVAQQWPTWSDGVRVAASEVLQQKMWEFHTAAIHEALNDASTLAALSQMYNDPNTYDEARFADAWGNYMVDLLAAVNFPLDQLPINFFNNNALPQRVLQPGDLDPTTTTLAPAEFATVTAGIAFADFERAYGRPITRAATMIANFGGPAVTELRGLIQDAIASGAQGIQMLWSRIVSILRRLPFSWSEEQDATALIAQVDGPVDGPIAA